MNSFSSLLTSNWSDNFMKLKKPQKSKEQKEREWEEKAVKSLEKKLENREGALEKLELVLERRTANTPCITLNRTQDGRVQINGRKIYPHYAYCKIWRWPDLENHNELKPLTDYCNHSFHSKQDALNEVCVNPYHYERVKTNTCSSPDQLYNQNSFSNASLSNCSFSSSFNEQASMNQSINQMNQQSMNQSFNDQSLNQYYLKVESPNSPTSLNQSSNDRLLNQYYTNVESSITQTSNQQLSDYSNSRFNQTNNNMMYNSNSVSNVTQNSLQNCSTQTCQASSSIQSTCFSNSSLNNWCSVVFFEYKNRLGKKLISSNRHIISGLDLPKYLHRNDGIQIHNKNGEVFIETNCKVYIQSAFLNLINNIELKSVLEIERGFVKIFDENLFEQMIMNNFQGGYEALSSLIKFSTCKLSFTYGWSKNIEIIQRPCWLEISMDRALSALDKPLSQLGSANQQVTSVS